MTTNFQQVYHYKPQTFFLQSTTCDTSIFLLQLPRTVQLNLIQANMGADTSPYNRDFCYGSVTVTVLLCGTLKLQLRNGAFIGWEYKAFSQEHMLNYEQICKILSEDQEVINVITKDLLNVYEASYTLDSAQILANGVSVTYTPHLAVVVAFVFQKQLLLVMKASRIAYVLQCLIFFCNVGYQYYIHLLSYPRALFRV